MIDMDELHRGFLVAENGWFNSFYLLEKAGTAITTDVLGVITTMLADERNQTSIYL